MIWESMKGGVEGGWARNGFTRITRQVSSNVLLIHITFIPGNVTRTVLLSRVGVRVPEENI